MIPEHLSEIYHPQPTPERRRPEAILKIPIDIDRLTPHVSDEVIVRIEESLYYVHDEKAVELRSHRYESGLKNSARCHKMLDYFVRNVANEIMYRKRLVTAMKVINGEVGYSRSPRYVSSALYCARAILLIQHDF